MGCRSFSIVPLLVRCGFGKESSYTTPKKLRRRVRVDGIRSCKHIVSRYSGSLQVKAFEALGLQGPKVETSMAESCGETM